MKKIMSWLFVCAIGITASVGNVYGVAICLRDATYVAFLSKSTNGVSGTADSTENTWSVEMNYKISNRDISSVSGIASCNEIAGTAGTADSTVSFSKTDTGVNCWCKMQIPLSSDWVFYGASSSDADCASNCATNCMNSVKSSESFRTALYESVW